MKGALALGLVAAALAAPACAAVDSAPATRGAPAPSTKLTVRTWLEGGRPDAAYTLTCGPARIAGLPPGRLRPLDACRAVGLVGDRIYRRSLSTHVEGCAYVQAPRRVEILGRHRGRAVRTSAEVGACDRLLVPAATLGRFVAWTSSDR